VFDNDNNNYLVFFSIALMVLAPCMYFGIGLLLKRRENKSRREAEGTALNRAILASQQNYLDVAAKLQISDSRMKDYIFGRKQIPKTVYFAVQYFALELERSAEVELALKQLYANSADDRPTRAKMRLITGGRASRPSRKTTGSEDSVA